jgi:diguanylate cyclase (GGDEF) domain
MVINETNEISFLGEFKDKALEREFFNHDMKRASRYIRPVILALGFLYMLFIIPDYMLIKNRDTFYCILLNRAGFLFLVLLLYFKMKKMTDYTILAYWITAYELIATFSFLLILNKYESPNYLIQSFGVMIIILAVFLVPNRWINMQIVSFFIIIMFLMLSVHYFKGLKASEFSAGIVYIIIAAVLNSIASHRTSYYKRKQYIDSKTLLSLSITDPLTGIYNRAKFDDELEKWVDYSVRYVAPLSLVLFDFDNFKMMNDNYGHLFGDKIMLEIVAIIKKEIRQTDVFARWGGDEFVILLPNTDSKQALELTERLRNSIESNKFDKIKKITCSFGLANLKTNENAGALLHRADKLLYKAKKQGKNQIAC